jgi:hypothetical protein
MRPIPLLLAALLSGVTLAANIRVATVTAHHYPSQQLGADVLPQLQNIKRRLVAGEGETMQTLFPEGWFFSHIIYGYSWVNVALSTSDETLQQHAIQEVRWVLAQVDTPQGLAPFSQDTQVKHGVFYLGWSNRLLGGLLKIQNPKARSPTDIARFHAQSAELAQAYSASPTATLESYPGMAWPCDQTVALASLALHDDLYSGQDQPRYQPIIQKWIRYTQRHLDPETQLIPHKINATTGQIDIGGRGSSQVYLLAFLPELDRPFAAQQYARFRQQFVPALGILPVREYAIGNSGTGDVDSGPLILGLGPTSTIASAAAARANGDAQLFDSTLLITELLGFPWTWGQEKSYGLGQLIVIDDFLVWGKSLVPWTAAQPAVFTNQTLELERCVFHLGSLFLLLAVWGLVFYRKKARS